MRPCVLTLLSGDAPLSLEVRSGPSSPGTVLQFSVKLELEQEIPLKLEWTPEYHIAAGSPGHCGTYQQSN